MGRIVSIKRFEIHDGDGIRTTVFLKGCPLNCHWCHNPECISPLPQLAYLEPKCLHCGICSAICPAHMMENGMHRYLPERCVACGKCAPQCLGEALRFYGEEITVEELLPRLLEDRQFYERSGGGVTISGGEPLMQPEFTIELLTLLKAEGIHTALDTCGFAPLQILLSVAEVTDTFLYDIKAIDDAAHIRATGQSNRQILDNFRALDAYDCNVEVRIPFVPEYNGDQMEKIGSFLQPLRCVKLVKLLPYHSYGNAKYAPVGKTAKEIPLPEDEEIAQAITVLRGFGLRVENGRD